MGCQMQTIRGFIFVHVEDSASSLRSLLSAKNISMTFNLQSTKTTTCRTSVSSLMCIKLVNTDDMSMLESAIHNGTPKGT